MRWAEYNGVCNNSWEPWILNMMLARFFTEKTFNKKKTNNGHTPIQLAQPSRDPFQLRDSLQRTEEGKETVLLPENERPLAENKWKERIKRSKVKYLSLSTK